MALPPTTPPTRTSPHTNPPAPAVLDAPTCPLCHQPNRCSAAANGQFDAPCWCQHVVISAAVLARVPAPLRGRACLCQACAEPSPEAAADAASADPVPPSNQPFQEPA